MTNATRLLGRQIAQIVGPQIKLIFNPAHAMTAEADSGLSKQGGVFEGCQRYRGVDPLGQIDLEGLREPRPPMTRSEC